MEALLLTIQGIAASPLGLSIISQIEHWAIGWLMENMGKLQVELGKDFASRLGAIAAEAEKWGMNKLTAAIGVIQQAVDAAVVTPGGSTGPELMDLHHKGLVSTKALIQMSKMDAAAIDKALGVS